MATITFYNKFRENQFNGVSVVDFDTDTIKVALATASYTPDAATHDFFSDITNEVTGAGYTAGGAQIGSVVVSESAGVVTVDGADVAWAQTVGGFTTARYAIIYKDTGVAGTSPLVGYIDFVTDKGNVDGDFTVRWNANGIFRVT